MYRAAKDGLDAVYAIEAGEEGVRVLLAVAVVLWDEEEQEVHLLLAHRLDQEAVIIGHEEHAA